MSESGRRSLSHLAGKRAVAILAVVGVLALSRTCALAQDPAFPANEQPSSEAGSRQTSGQSGAPQTTSQSSGAQLEDRQTGNQDPAGQKPGDQQTGQPTSGQQTESEHAKQQINVNWLYGSFVPKDVPLIPLTPHQRFKLYLRQTYITWGIYLKTVIFALDGQRRNSPPEWDGGFSGFGKRALSYQGQFIIQNSITHAGDALLGWEPRYERCRCSGAGPRTWHAVKRNFVTYNSSDSSLRPQIMPFAGAAGGAAMAAAAWQPGNPSAGIKAYQSAITQIFVGVGVNLLAEYAPEVMRLIHKDKNKNKKASAEQH